MTMWPVVTGWLEFEAHHAAEGHISDEDHTELSLVILRCAGCGQEAGAEIKGARCCAVGRVNGLIQAAETAGGICNPVVKRRGMP